MELQKNNLITPAIIDTKIYTDKQLSSEEFQKILYHWFHQNGMVSNIRTFLRMKMISAIRETVIGESLNKSNNFTKDNQILNVLIADYLYRERYDYSLSIFSSEAPMKTLVSEFCFFIFNKEEALKSRFKVDEENVMHIVESLGIDSSSDIAREIYLKYQDSQNDSLLYCILKLLPNYHKSEEPAEDGYLEEISKVIRRITIHFDLPHYVIKQLTQKMNNIVKNEVNNAINKLNKEYENEKFILRVEYENKECEFKHKLKEVDKFLNSEMKKIENEHNRLVYLTGNLVSNEKNIKIKSKELEEKLKKVEELEIKLTEEIQHYSRIKVSSPEQRLSPEPCNLKHCGKQCEENRKEIEQLTIQKNGFEKMTENQNILIANLQAKSNIMYKQLQEGMYTIEDLRDQLMKQKKLLEKERLEKELTSERTVSSSEALTIGVDGEGDHNIEDTIRQTHLKLEELEKESNEIELKFKLFEMSLKEQ